MAAAPESLAPPPTKLPTPGPEPAHQETEEAAGAEASNHRNSTFLTEVEDSDRAGVAVSSIAEIVAAVDKVEELGSIIDINDKKESSPAPTKEDSPAPVPSKEVSPAPTKETSPEPAKETSPEPTKKTTPEPAKEASPAPEKEASPPPVKETSPEPTKEASPAPAPVKEASPAPIKEASPAPAPVKEASPAPIKEASPTPAKEVSPEPPAVRAPSPAPIKETSPVPEKEASPAPVKVATPVPEVEPIGAVEDLKAEVNALLSSPAEPATEEKEEAELIDIAVIDEPVTSATSGIEEVEVDAVLNKIPDKKEIIEEAKESIAKIDTDTKESPSVIDIRTGNEETEDTDVLDLVKAAQDAFTAEIIPDNVDIEVVPDDGEEVIEFTLNSADAIPIGAIAVATFAIFLALIFYYN